MNPARPALAVILLLLVRPDARPAQNINWNVRGDAPNAKLVSPADERAQFHLPPGFEIQLVASEPDIQKPLNFNFDSAGRLWVSGTELYPWPATVDALGQPIASFQKNTDANQLAFKGPVPAPAPSARGRDTVRVLSDFDPETGRARKISLFADGLNIPIGILPLPRAPGARGDSVISYSIPDIWRFEDTDGDGRADVRQRLYSEFGFKDTHGMVSNFTLWIDGWVYGTHGFSNHSEVRDGAGNLTVLESGNTYRFRLDGSVFEQWTHGQTNPFGLAFDPRGDVYTADSHSKPVYLLIHGGFYEGLSRKHDGLGFAPSITLDDHGSSAIAGIAYYAATQFPPEYRGNLFNGNVVTRKINRDRLEWSGSTPAAVRMPDFLTCDDPSFRPVQVKLGPDGALWVADFYNPIIGHYEVPLTHPSRDHAHGRIWRIVWRGTDHSVPLPTLPDLSTASAAQLVEKISDPNLIVRTLAVNELVIRVGAQAAVPALRAAAASIQGDAALPFAFALERLGAQDDKKLFSALDAATADDEAALAALRVLASRPGLGVHGEAYFAAFVARSSAGHLWRATADLFASRPEPWQAPLILTMLARTPAEDQELNYALRLALKAQVARATLEDLQRLGAPRLDVAARIADAALAVQTPAAGEFLLDYLKRSNFTDPRAGEFARHAVMQLPPGRSDSLDAVVASLGPAPAAQRIAFAEGLAAASGLPDRKFPTAITTWMRETLVAGFSDADGALAVRALEATKALKFPEKNPALLVIARDSARENRVRIAAIKSLQSNDESVKAMAGILNRTSDPLPVRRAALDELNTRALEKGQRFAPALRTAFAIALPAANYDFAIAMATGLAKSEAGAEELIQLVAGGKAPVTLLRHRQIATALSARSEGIRTRVADLTRNLPSEDARIDAVIRARTEAFDKATPNVAHGARIFAQNCAVCHRIANAGGNIGPNLDGIGSRGAQRVIEDILDPSRNVDPMFRIATLTLKNGETKSGMNLREATEGMIVTDPGTSQDIVIPKASIASTAVSPASPMPATFESAFFESDFYDLLAYLLAPTH